MARFSFLQALSAGFRVIGRRPWLVAVWALAYLLLVVGPIYLVLMQALPDLIAGYQDAARQAVVAGGPPDPGPMLAAQSRMFRLQPVFWLISLVSNAILVGAIFRAVLEPEKSRWGYLRVGRQELWLGLTNLALIVILFGLMLTFTVPLSIGWAVARVAAQHGGGSDVRNVLLWLIGVCGWIAILWAMIRFSLALPMSFAERRFVLYESWGLTRGQSLKMFLVLLVLVIVVWAIELLVSAVVGGLEAGKIIDHPAWRGIVGASAEAAAHRLTPAIVGFAAVASLIGMGLYTIMMAPWAEIYRELKTTPKA